jgi:hypothetical protein
MKRFSRIRNCCRSSRPRVPPGHGPKGTCVCTNGQNKKQLKQR